MSQPGTPTGERRASGSFLSRRGRRSYSSISLNTEDSRSVALPASRSVFNHLLRRSATVATIASVASVASVASTAAEPTPSREFVFIRDEALTTLAPPERRKLRTVLDYVEVVAADEEPSTSRRQSVDFSCYGDAFKQNDENDASELIRELDAHRRVCNDGTKCKSPNLLKTRFPITGFAIAPGCFAVPNFDVDCNLSDYYGMPLIEDQPCYGSNVPKPANPDFLPNPLELNEQALAWAEFREEGGFDIDDEFVPNKSYPPRKQTAVQSVIIYTMFSMSVSCLGPLYAAVETIQELSDEFLEDSRGTVINISKTIDTYDGKRIVKLPNPDDVHPAHRQNIEAQMSDPDVIYVDEKTWNRAESYIVKDDECPLVKVVVPQHSQLNDGSLAVVLSLFKRTRTWDDENSYDENGKEISEARKEIGRRMRERELESMVKATVENYLFWRLKRTEFLPSANLPVLKPGEW